MCRRAIVGGVQRESGVLSISRLVSRSWLRMADAAMYVAKRGRLGFRLWDEQLGRPSPGPHSERTGVDRA